jgi:hypothetical protein
VTNKPVLRMVEFDIKEQTESDAFLRRIAECKSSAEVRDVVAEVKKLHEANTDDRGSHD